MHDKPSLGEVEGRTHNTTHEAHAGFQFTESRRVYPVPGTEEHRCAVFTHNQRADLGISCQPAVMSAATASISDVSRSNFINQDDGRDRGGTGEKEYCTTRCPSYNP